MYKIELNTVTYVVFCESVSSLIDSLIASGTLTLGNITDVLTWAEIQDPVQKGKLSISRGILSVGESPDAVVSVCDDFDMAEYTIIKQLEAIRILRNDKENEEKQLAFAKASVAVTQALTKL